MILGTDNDRDSEGHLGMLGASGVTPGAQAHLMPVFKTAVGCMQGIYLSPCAVSLAWVLRVLKVMSKC